LINSGQSIYVVSKLLGHSQIKTTTRYSHLSDATLLSAVDSAANAMDFKSQDRQQAMGQLKLDLTQAQPHSPSHGVFRCGWVVGEKWASRCCQRTFGLAMSKFQFSTGWALGGKGKSWVQKEEKPLKT
jgi:hypothetical protein